MIGISYKKATPEYDDYLNRVQGYMFWHPLGGQRKIPYDVECRRFSEMYLLGSNFAEFMNKPAADLRVLIQDVENNFPQLRSCRLQPQTQTTTPLYIFLYYHFVERGYKNGYQMNKVKYEMPKDEIIDAIDTAVCPYCNRSFIYSSKSKNGGKIVHAELDHFFSKDLFPYLAIAKYNLVPSCSSCNKLGGKYTTDAYDQRMVNPFEIQKTDDYLTFRLRVKNAAVTSLTTLANGLSLKLIEKHPNMRSNIDILNLEELYQHHTDYAAELYFKWLLKATRVYRTSVKGILRRQGINLSDDDIKRIIVGNYIREQDFANRPLSKMMHDIARELGLI